MIFLHNYIGGDCKNSTEYGYRYFSTKEVINIKIKSVYKTPDNWVRINPDEYKRYHVLNNDDEPCDNAYIAPNGSNCITVISIHVRSNCSLDYLKQMHSTLSEMEKHPTENEDVSKCISENDYSDPFDIDDCVIDEILPIYHKFLDIFEYRSYVNIMRISTMFMTEYSIQISVLYKNNALYTFEANASDIDEVDPLLSFCEKCLPVMDIFDIVIPSMESKMHK